MSELKPCPYCGETPKRPEDFFGTDGENLWGVSCENVNCHVDIGVWHEDEDEAIRMWNTLPRTLRWTKEPPMKPGIYLLSRAPIKKHGITVKQISTAELEELRRTSWEQDIWFGPIQEPVE